VTPRRAQASDLMRQICRDLPIGSLAAVDPATVALGHVLENNFVFLILCK
jgi:hypothetical protein